MKIKWHKLSLNTLYEKMFFLWIVSSFLYAFPYHYHREKFSITVLILLQFHPRSSISFSSTSIVLLIGYLDAICPWSWHLKHLNIFVGIIWMNDSFTFCFNCRLERWRTLLSFVCLSFQFWELRAVVLFFAWLFLFSCCSALIALMDWCTNSSISM